MTNKDQWPVPDYNKHDEASFIFVICPPYSGSTAFSQLFSSSRYVAQLNRKAEGQQLIPGLFQADRWHKDKHVSYESIRAVWLAKYQQIKRKNASIEWVIEKSPPNMMRLASLQACFSSNFTIALIRDPYATCASAVYRNVKNIESLSIKERKLCFQRSAQRWVKKSTQIQQLIQEQHIPLIRYEDLCGNTAASLTTLSLPQKLLESINIKSELSVKDYPPQALSNKNQQQLALLQDHDIQAISEVLQNHPKLLLFYGYPLMH